MPYAELNGARYRFQVQGAGKPLLLLHGFTGSGQSWAPHAAVFGRNYLTVTVDLLGHGGSDAPEDPDRFSMKDSAADIAQLLAQMTAEPANLLGYSMGGRLALYFALNYPSSVRSLILESASPGLDGVVAQKERINRDNQLAEAIERDGIERFVDRWQRLPLFASQEQLPESARAELRRQRLKNRANGLAGSLRGMGTGRQPALWGQLPALKVPLMLLAGELDPKFVGIGRQMAALIDGSRLRVIPDVGHTIHLENPGLFQELILGFLDENSG